MPHIYIAPTIQPVLVERRGIISVPGEKQYLLRCNGTRIQDIPLTHRALQVALYEAGKAFIRNQAKRGNVYYDKENIHVYGPFPSYGFNENLLSLDDPALKDGGDPALMAQMAKPRAQKIEAWADYLLVAKFIQEPQKVEYEVKEESNGQRSHT